MVERKCIQNFKIKFSKRTKKIEYINIWFKFRFLLFNLLGLIRFFPFSIFFVCSIFFFCFSTAWLKLLNFIKDRWTSHKKKKNYQKMQSIEMKYYRFKYDINITIKLNYNWNWLNLVVSLALNFKRFQFKPWFFAFVNLSFIYNSNLNFVQF